MASETERAWVAQWRSAGAALAAQRAQELAAMTDEQALAAADAVLWLAATGPAPVGAERLQSSGLVEQQARLHGLRAR